LEAVRAGVVTGIVFAATMKGRRYYIKAAGALERDPTYARGILATLDDQLAEQIHGKADFDTTL
jgi:hypothetical protein